MKTIDPEAEPVRDQRRWRTLAWSIGVAALCFAIVLVIVSLLMRQPDRKPDMVSPGDAPAFQEPAVGPQGPPPVLEQLAPTPPTALPSEPGESAKLPQSSGQPSGDAGYLAPPPPATAEKPQPKPESKPAPAPTRRPTQTPAARTNSVAQMVLATASAQPAQGDPINAPIVLNQGQEKRVMLYTDLRGLAGQTVSHRWEYQGQTVAVIPFEVKGGRWRVHSTKRLTSGMKGSWQVLVVDGKGTTLASRSFVVQ